MKKTAMYKIRKRLQVIRRLQWVLTAVCGGCAAALFVLAGLSDTESLSLLHTTGAVLGCTCAASMCMLGVPLCVQARRVLATRLRYRQVRRGQVAPDRVQTGA